MTDKTQEYWDNRVDEYRNDKSNMVWVHSKIKQHFNWFADFMKQFQNQSVLDVGCGYGRISPLCTGEYLGIDFSPKMIEVAKEEFPDKTFEVQDAYTYTPTKKYDIIVVFHLSGLPERQKEIVDRYLPYTSRSLVIVYADYLIHFMP